MRRRLFFFFLTGAVALLLCSCNRAKNEHLALWADKKISDVIPKGQEEEYEKLWEIPMTRLSEDNWKEFSENASLVYVYCSDNADDAPIGDKRIRIDATNWVIYNTIKEELE